MSFLIFMSFDDYKIIFVVQENFLLKTGVLALMGAASFCGGVRHKRYSVQQVPASNSSDFKF
ncbi:hypothetical protein ACFSC2_08275 [Flavobacterium artemisiae]|uniref:Lipoprotein n=1 Tax=Flavobacterium artemisiae TaxID=2126556 RepID=A0ABW4HB65_9FLAO